MTCMTCTFMVLGALVQVIFIIKTNGTEQGTARDLHDLHLSYSRKSSTLTCTPCTHMPDFFFLREKPAFSNAA